MQITDASSAKSMRAKDHAWLNLVRIIATIFIIMAHSDWRWGGGVAWTQTLYYTVTRAGVPLFFMSTGYLLISQREDLLGFLKNHLLPVLVAFFFWSSIYDLLANDVFYKGTTMQDIAEMFLHILRSARIGYFWFFYSLIGLYLFIPILRLIGAAASKTEINYYLVLWFLSFAFAPMIRSVISIKYGLEAPFVQRYLGYFLLGHYLGQEQETPRSIHYAIGIFVASFAFTFAVFQFDLPPRDNEDFFRSYMSFNVICMSSALFSILKWTGKSLPANLHRMSDLLDQNTFGVYLIHPIVMGWMFNAALLFRLALPYNTALIVPTVALGVFLASSLIATILRRIPLIKYAIPQLGK